MMIVIRSGLCVVVRLPAKGTLGSFLGDENVLYHYLGSGYRKTWYMLS